MRRVGLVVNPIAGMGGRVGLKGTDNKVEEARRRGAEPRAPNRARQALEHLREQPIEVELYTYGGVMGEDEAVAAGFSPVVVGHSDDEETSREDTREAVRRFVRVPPEEERNGRAAESSERAELSRDDGRREAPSGPPRDRGVDLILFVGGDGTAVDVAGTLDELDADVPVLGVPGGVKVYSSVFAVTPRAAGRIATTFERTETREVNDIDEDAYRGGDVNTELKALAEVPVGDEVQSSKQIGGGTVEALADAVAGDIAEDDATYVLGPGSTVDAVKTELGFNGSPLGVDVWRDGDLVARDAGESDILANLGDRNVVVVSPIGGQGFIFGRGNDQISPEVIRRSDVEVVASKQKLDDIGVLRVDTGDPELDEELRGWQRVRVGKFERRLLKVV